MYLCMYLCIYVSMHLCIYLSMNVSMYLCTYVSTYVSMYLCIHLSMYLSMGFPKSFPKPFSHPGAFTATSCRKMRGGMPPLLMHTPKHLDPRPELQNHISTHGYGRSCQPEALNPYSLQLYSDTFLLYKKLYIF